jgi:hypothetical protein
MHGTFLKEEIYWRLNSSRSLISQSWFFFIFVSKRSQPDTWEWTDQYCNLEWRWMWIKVSLKVSSSRSTKRWSKYPSPAGNLWTRCHQWSNPQTRLTSCLIKILWLLKQKGEAQFFIRNPNLTDSIQRRKLTVIKLLWGHINANIFWLKHPTELLRMRNAEPSVIIYLLVFIIIASHPCNDKCELFHKLKMFHCSLTSNRWVLKIILEFMAGKAMKAHIEHRSIVAAGGRHLGEKVELTECHLNYTHAFHRV